MSRLRLGLREERMPTCYAESSKRGVLVILDHQNFRPHFWCPKWKLAPMQVVLNKIMKTNHQIMKLNSVAGSVGLSELLLALH